MDPTALRPLGRTSLMVSALGFGAAPLGGMYAAVDEREAIAAVLAAFDEGLDYFDVAPLYGLGLAEERLGRALRERSRGSYVVSTKVGRLLHPLPPGAPRDALFTQALPYQVAFDYTREGVLRSLEDSRRRLGMERIDIVLIHDVNRHWQGEDLERRFREVMDGGYPELVRLREQGVIGAIGVGMNDAAMCARFARAGDFDCFMLAGRYTLLDQSSLDDLLPLCEARRIGVLAAAPFNSGILATGAAPGAKFFYRDAPPEIQAKVARIERICERHRVPLAAAALQFPLAHPAVASVVTGMRSAEEVRDNLRLARHRIPAGLWHELREAGLVRLDAPVS